jgi:uncharacterized membrane protein
MNAEKIIKERYARGEIDRAEYLEMLHTLKAQASGSTSRNVGLPAEEILRERFARSEIDGTQFKEMKDELKKDRP